ncbi:class I SAM-dependent methyltransferase [Vreelandella aquamarina]
MSNSDPAHKLNQQLEKSQRFWGSAQGCALLDAQRACLGPIIETRNKGRALELGMGPSMLYPTTSSAALSHIIQWAPNREAAQCQETLICPLNDLALPDGCMDITLVHHWLEHANDAHHLLQEAARVTSDHGVLLIFGFNPVSFGNLSRYMRPKRHKYPEKNQQRAVWRSPRSLRDWLAFVDFDVERVDYCGFRVPFMRPCEASLETLGRRQNVPVSEAYMIRARRRQQPVSTSRVRFGMPLAPPGRSFQVFSRASSAKTTTPTEPRNPSVE